MAGHACGMFGAMDIPAGACESRIAERSKPLPPVLGRTRRFSWRIFWCFGHTSPQALDAPEMLRGKSWVDSDFLARLEDFFGNRPSIGGFQGVAFIHGARFSADSLGWKQTSCVGMESRLASNHPCCSAYWNRVALICPESRNLKATDKLPCREGK